MDKGCNAERHVRSCHGCQLVMKPDMPEPLRMIQLPEAPWQDPATDILGPFPTGESILVVVDYYSRYYEYVILKSTTADKIIDLQPLWSALHPQIRLWTPIHVCPIPTIF